MFQKQKMNEQLGPKPTRNEFLILLLLDKEKLFSLTLTILNQEEF
jgi:hypothetical protein